MAFYLTLMMGEINPSPVPKAVIDALTEVQVTSAAGSASGFQLKFTLGKNSPISSRFLPSGFFDPGMRVIITITVNGAPHVLMDGVITQQDVTANSQPGQSTLTVTGSDLTVYMDFVDLTGIPYTGIDLEARVLMILAKYIGLGVIPLVIPSILKLIKLPIEDVPLHKGTDLEYINLLAQTYGHVFYIEPGPKPGTSIAYWGPEVRRGLPQPALSVDFGANTNVESMNFSYNGLSRELLYAFITEPITKASIPIPIPDITPLKPPLAKKRAAILKVRPMPEAGKYDPVEIALIGLAGTASSTDAITASGQLDVQRYGNVLRSRRLVAVRGAGINYDGLYFVKSVTHNIKVGEYKQSFSLVRGGIKSTISQVRA